MEWIDNESADYVQTAKRNKMHAGAYGTLAELEYWAAEEKRASAIVAAAYLSYVHNK